MRQKTAEKINWLIFLAATGLSAFLVLSGLALAIYSMLPPDWLESLAAFRLV